MITRTLPDGGNGSKLSDIDLEKGLFDVEDLLERTMTPFVLLGKTAESVKNGNIEGEFVEVGVKETDLTDYMLSTLKTFTLGEFKDEITEKGRYISYVTNGVLVKIKVLTKKFKFLDNPDHIFYKFAQYRVPNPLDSYLKAQHLVK